MDRASLVSNANTEMEIQMNIAEIKAAVDAGKAVHWANEGYRVHRDGLGQYLITFVRNGSTIGLTDRSGKRLNGAEADFFISEPGHDGAAAQGREVRGVTSDTSSSVGPG